MSAKNLSNKSKLFLQCSSLFLHVSVSSQLNKESMDAPCVRTAVCMHYAMAVCCVRLLLSEQCTVNDVHMQTMRKQHILTNFYYSDSIIRNRFQWIGYSGMNILIYSTYSNLAFNAKMVQWLKFTKLFSFFI